jgi:hypothetical protein
LPFLSLLPFCHTFQIEILVLDPPGLLHTSRPVHPLIIREHLAELEIEPDLHAGDQQHEVQDVVQFGRQGGGNDEEKALLESEPQEQEKEQEQETGKENDYARDYVGYCYCNLRDVGTGKIKKGVSHILQYF